LSIEARIVVIDQSRGGGIMRGRKPSPAIIVASVALFVALGGTALAAKRYLITSASEIKPSVLRAGERAVARDAGLKGGAYEVELSAPGPVLHAGTSRTLALRELPSGHYTIFATGVLQLNESHGGLGECILTAGANHETSHAGGGGEGGKLPTVVISNMTASLTYGEVVTLGCTWVGSAERWNLETGTRIIAIKVAGQHRTVAASE
jgi:hypothetical protein